MIAILCPTRGRPEQFKHMMESAYKTSDANIFCSTSEEEWISYMLIACYSMNEYGKFLNCLHMPDGLPTAHKWNVLANFQMKNPETKLFMLGADDMIFETPGWDKALIDHYNALENKIHV